MQTCLYLFWKIKFNIIESTCDKRKARTNNIIIKKTIQYGKALKCAKCTFILDTPSALVPLLLMNILKCRDISCLKVYPIVFIQIETCNFSCFFMSLKHRLKRTLVVNNTNIKQILKRVQLFKMIKTPITHEHTSKLSSARKPLIPVNLAMGAPG